MDKQRLGEAIETARSNITLAESQLSTTSNLTLPSGEFKSPIFEVPETFTERTRKLASFVKALLRLTQIRLSSNIEMEFFSLKNTISAALDTVGTKAQDKSIALKSNIDLAEDKVFGIPLSVEEAITNLLLNAVKYTPAGGTVEINVKENGDCALVEIIDTGIGIPEEELPKIFDEFYRAANAKKIEKDGTGLGLSIVKQIIERHSGKIWVESRENVGTKFSFILPKTDYLQSRLTL